VLSSTSRGFEQVDSKEGEKQPTPFNAKPNECANISKVKKKQEENVK
jgi:hypothetical protein